MKSAFKSVGDPWSGIHMFLTTLLCKQKYEEIADIAQCLIKKCQQDMESSVVDVSEIEDIELKKQIGKTNQTQSYLNSFRQSQRKVPRDIGLVN